MDKWFKDILPDKDPYHNRGRGQMRKKGGPEFECLCKQLEVMMNRTSLLCGNRNRQHGTQNVKTQNRATKKKKEGETQIPPKNVDCLYE
jgi:hypothetical protein